MSKKTLLDFSDREQDEADREEEDERRRDEEHRQVTSAASMRYTENGPCHTRSRANRSLVYIHPAPPISAKSPDTIPVHHEHTEARIQPTITICR